MIRFACALCLLLCLPAQALAAHWLRFLPQWQPQAQFAGYYMAKELGLYTAEGLDVEILTGGPDAPAGGMLAAGETELASMFLATAMRRADAGAELVNVAQLVRHSSLMLVAKKKNRVSKLSDLAGRKVSVWGAEFEIQPRAYFAKEGVKARFIPQGATVNLFLLDGVAAASAMRYNEYHLILNSGLNPDELFTVDFRDTPFDFPEDGIYCRASYLNEHPEAVAGFVRASLAGWRAAFDDPEAALDLVMKRARGAGVATNRVHQRWMLSRIRQAMAPDEAGFGRLDQEAYAVVARTLEAGGWIVKAPDYDAFYAGERP